jgi:tetratricopeptide (TPR) repeat protein
MHKTVVIDPNSAKAAALHSEAAQALHKQGKFAEAESHYRAALTTDQRHAESLHGLGLLCLQCRRYAEAVDLLNRAAESSPDDVAIRSNLGYALLRLQRRVEAIAAFRSAVEIQPDYTVAHFNMGMALSELGRHEEAVAAFDKTIATKPDHYHARYQRGLSLLELSRHDEAVADLVLVRKHNPTDINVFYALGSALKSAGRNNEALALFKEALKKEPNSPAAHNNYGLTLAILARHDEAIVHYEKALELDRKLLTTYSNLSNSLNSLGRSEEALAVCHKALAIDPDNLSGIIGTGYSKMCLGRMDDAIVDFERGLRIDPDLVECHRYLAEIKAFTEDDPRIAQIDKVTATMAGKTTSQRSIVHFIRFKIRADLKQYDDAFAELVEGNRLWRSVIAYNEEKELRALRDMTSLFTPELLRRKAGLGNPSSLPIFIIGMPRSGTTLIEQILASHPFVFGGDELIDFGLGVVGSYDPEPLPFDVANLSSDDLKRLGGIYIDRVSPKAPAAQRITDKRPDNMRFAGFIHLVLPNARIIHVRRDPRDTCISCYSLFPPASFKYTYDLAELGRYYRAYEELMAHWRAVLPQSAFIEVQYEDVIENLEEQARRLIAFCGLEWDPRCLDFHKTDRSVRTASLAQVRQPLYKSSVGRWRRYESHLQPLLEALGRLT